VAGAQIVGAVDFIQLEGDDHAGAAAHAFFLGVGEDHDFAGATGAAIHSSASGVAPQTSIRSMLFLPPLSRRAPPDQTAGTGLGAGASHAESWTVRVSATEPDLLPLEFLEPLPFKPLELFEFSTPTPLMVELHIGCVEALQERRNHQFQSLDE
jgi:hypothetical protein